MHKQDEIDMANTNPHVKLPNATIFYLLALGVALRGNANFGHHIVSARVFRYQLVGIDNMKLLRWGSRPT